MYCEATLTLNLWLHDHRVATASTCFSAKVFKWCKCLPRVQRGENHVWYIFSQLDFVFNLLKTFATPLNGFISCLMKLMYHHDVTAIKSHNRDIMPVFKISLSGRIYASIRQCKTRFGCYKNQMALWSNQHYDHRLGNFHLALSPIMLLSRDSPNSQSNSDKIWSFALTIQLMKFHTQKNMFSNLFTYSAWLNSQ